VNGESTITVFFDGSEASEDETIEEEIEVGEAGHEPEEEETGDKGADDGEEGGDPDDDAEEEDEEKVDFGEVNDASSTNFFKNRLYRFLMSLSALPGSNFARSDHLNPFFFV